MSKVERSVVVGRHLDADFFTKGVFWHLNNMAYDKFTKKIFAMVKISTLIASSVSKVELLDFQLRNTFKYSELN